MFIKVKFSNYNNSQIIDYYNSKKDPLWFPLEDLDRTEGGFKIALRNLKDKECCDANSIIKQVRWHRKQLTTPPGYYSFSKEETQLLYESFLQFHPPEDIELIGEPKDLLEN